MFKFNIDSLDQINIYVRVFFTNAQAICDPPSVETIGPAMITSAANRLQSAFWVSYQK